MTNDEAISAKEKGVPVVVMGVKYRCIRELFKEFIHTRYQQGYVLRAYVEDINGNSVTKARVKDIKLYESKTDLKYYYHPESDCLFTLRHDEELGDDTDSQLCIELTEEEYYKKKKEQNL